MVWFEKAAKAGVPQAMLNLGKMLENVRQAGRITIMYIIIGGLFSVW